MQVSGTEGWVFESRVGHIYFFQNNIKQAMLAETGHPSISKLCLGIMYNEDDTHFTFSVAKLSDRNMCL